MQNINRLSDRLQSNLAQNIPTTKINNLTTHLNERGLRSAQRGQRGPNP